MYRFPPCWLCVTSFAYSNATLPRSSLLRYTCLHDSLAMNPSFPEFSHGTHRARWRTWLCDSHPNFPTSRRIDFFSVLSWNTPPNWIVSFKWSQWSFPSTFLWQPVSGRFRAIYFRKNLSTVFCLSFLRDLLLLDFFSKHSSVSLCRSSRRRRMIPRKYTSGVSNIQFWDYVPPVWYRRFQLSYFLVNRRVGIVEQPMSHNRNETAPSCTGPSTLTRSDVPFDRWRTHGYNRALRRTFRAAELQAFLHLSPSFACTFPLAVTLVEFLDFRRVPIAELMSLWAASASMFQNTTNFCSSGFVFEDGAGTTHASVTVQNVALSLTWAALELNTFA